MKPVFKRILLKISGEVLSGEQGHGFDFNVITKICEQIKALNRMGVEVAVVRVLIPCVLL